MAEEWLTYLELGERLGITASAARMHARRRGWQRRAPNAIGGQAHVLVPEIVDVHPRATAVQRTHDVQMSAEANGLNGADRANNDQVHEALCAAVAAFSDALAAERERVSRGEQRIEQLFAELTDARAAERISAESAAGLRHQLDLIRARRPWWRRWFR
jgi:hypothetical protein